jgi:hypothetical protein
MSDITIVEIKRKTLQEETYIVRSYSLGDGFLSLNLAKKDGGSVNQNIPLHELQRDIIAVAPDKRWVKKWQKGDFEEENMSNEMISWICENFNNQIDSAKKDIITKEHVALILSLQDDYYFKLEGIE